MWIIKNKVFLGIVCLVLAGILSIVIMNMSKSDLKTTTVIKVSSIITENQEIKEDMLKTETVSAYNLPSDVIKDKKQLVGKYAKTTIYPEDYLTMDKFQDQAKIQDVFLLSTNENKKAVSVTIKTLAAGLSGKIEPGDIVTVKCYVTSKSADSDVGYFMDFPRLKYVEVAAVSNSKAEDTDKLKNMNDKDKNGTETIIPATMTFLVTDQQAEDLIEIENIGNLHIVFAGRGEEAQKLLKQNGNSSTPTKKVQQNTRIKTGTDQISKEQNINNTDSQKSENANSDSGENNKNATVFDPNKGFDIK